MSDDSDFKKELRAMKEEMSELKEMLRKKAKEEIKEELNIGKMKAKGSKGGNFRVEFGDENIEFEGVDETLGDYLGSVMEGVAQNLSSSMKQMASGFQLGNFAKEMERAKHEAEKVRHEFEKNRHDLERELHNVGKEVERAIKSKSAHVIRFQKLSDEELEKFYVQAPDLTSALSDEKKLRLLKGLESGPQYQKDLSESTEIKGGTFKHHMDSLLDVKFVTQEAVRGRYMITQLGMEALKLSEMLFRRYVFATNEQAQEREVEVDFGDEIDEDISADAEAVDQQLQNEEEEG